MTIRTNGQIIAGSDINSQNLTTCHVVVETYVNSTSWYRVWDDGWVEQGGVIDSVSGNSYTAATINLLKPFSNTNYTVLLTQNDNGQTLGLDGATNGNSVHSKSINSFVIATYSWTLGRNWYACDMGA